MFSPRFAAKLSSLVWRLLTRYGRFKYRYLLPVYRLLRLRRKDLKPAGIARPSRTLRGAQAVANLLSGAKAGSYREQLKAVVGRVENSRGAVIFLPSVGWGVVNTQRSHHLAREFARQGYFSIFDSSNQYDDVMGFKEIEPNLLLFRGEESLLHEIPNPILWALTYNFDRKDSYPPSSTTVYDWIDDLEVFPYDRDFLEKNHAKALKEAAVVASVARRLHEQSVAARPDAIYLPNGVEYEHFASSTVQTPDDPALAAMLREGKPIAGYYGAMAEWFDYDLLERVAQMRTDWNFLLIGPKYDLSLNERGRQLLKRSNVRWIGARKYETLPTYLRAFDVAMIPFVVNNITLATSPLKLYEYFAGGKPVVTTPMTECMAYQEVHAVEDAESFSTALDVARRQSQDDHFRERLRRLARENSWAARVQLVMSHIQSTAANPQKDWPPVPHHNNSDEMLSQDL